MDDIEHTIAELMGVPMEDWPEWLEGREVLAEEILAIEHRLIGEDTGAWLFADDDWLVQPTT
ncbi:MAG: hypothetical protein ABI650_06665 [Dokdonella sp.]